MGLQSLFKRRPIVTIRQTLIALPFLLVALLGLISPYETIVVPEWRLSVLNLEGSQNQTCWFVKAGDTIPLNQSPITNYRPELISGHSYLPGAQY